MDVLRVIVYISYATRSGVSQRAFYVCSTYILRSFYNYVATPSLNNSHGRWTSDVRAMYKQCASDLRAIYERSMRNLLVPQGCSTSIWRTSGERSMTASHMLVERIYTWLYTWVSTYRRFFTSLVIHRSYKWQHERPLHKDFGRSHYQSCPTHFVQ